MDALLGAAILLIPIVLLAIKSRIKTQKRNLELKQNADLFNSILQRERLQVSKEIQLAEMSLIIDDIGKRWFLKNHQSQITKIYKYSDIAGYEVYEDGNSILSGRMGSALVGTALLGVSGAVIGSSGSKKQQSTCSILQVRIILNDLKQPELVIPCIRREVRKNSVIYRKQFETARQIAATLAFMQRQVESSPNQSNV